MTSSRKSVPPSEASMRPVLSRTAPVNEPFLCPKSSLSTKDSGIAPQLIGTKGAPARLPEKWMARATTSLPVPLSPEMIEILDEMRVISSRSQFIFPSEVKPLESMNSQTANMALKRMGYEGQLVSHGMRSLASTILNEHGFAPDIVESALAHTDKNTVRAAYNRAEYVERRRDMMDWWSKRVSQSRTTNLSAGALSITEQEAPQ